MAYCRAMRKANAVDGTALLHWVELALPEPPWQELEPFVGFVFLDPAGGLTARGGRAGDLAAAAAQPSLIVRLPIGVPGRVLPDAEAATRGLPAAPPWLASAGPQPIADAPWRGDPALRGKFHPQWPDDIQVLIDAPDGGGGAGEVCWLRVVAVDDPDARIYAGVLQHAPRALAHVQAGDRLRFTITPGARHPRMVR